MKRLFGIVLAALLGALAPGMTHAQFVPSALPVMVILDDDLGDDIDNYADWRAFNTMAGSGQLIPAGAISGTNETNAIPGIVAARNWSNQGYPIYRLAGNTGGVTWTQTVVNQFDNSDQNNNYASNCELGYRQLLNNAKRPVVIIIGGDIQCLDDLLDSPSNDGGDGLGTGASLIAAHVSYVIWAAGNWPSGTADPNMGQSGAQTADLFTNWAGLTGSVPFYLYGVNLTSAATGPFTTVCQTSTTDPYQLAYYAYSAAANPCTRTMWTQPAFLFVKEGPAVVQNATSTYFSIGAQGTPSYNSGTTANSFAAGSGPFYYLANVASQATLAAAVCNLQHVAGSNWAWYVSAGSTGTC